MFSGTVPASSFEGDDTIDRLQSAIFVTIGARAFADCDNLISVDLPSAKHIGGGAFDGCGSLEVVNLPMLESIGGISFSSCKSLTRFILRNKEIVPTKIGSTTYALFDFTPISAGTGYIYVPRALIDQYKTTDGWSDYASQFRALEDYTVDGTATGELDESKINT